MREQIIEKILQDKVIAIVRGYYGEDCLNLARALHKGGVNLIEVTYDQRSHEERLKTAATIRALVQELGDCMSIGAGTVTTVEMVEMTREAGGQFIISPDTCEEVIRATVANDMVSIPGALTPTEIMNAHRYGADFVKVFPVANLGASYLKAVKAPISHVRMLAVGGIDSSNVQEYIKAGALGTGVASCLFKKEWIEAGEWERITKAAREFIMLVQEAAQ